MTPISVCIIAKNEENNIEKCLQSLAPYQFEIIVVDTGSTDKTKEIALRYTSKVFDFEWINDFSAARNFASRQASNNWILVLDCDEYIQEINLPQILTLTTKHPKCIGLITIINAMGSGNDCAGNTYTTQLVRLYPGKYYHFVDTVHEQVMPIRKNLEVFSFDCPLTLYHTGYVGTSEELSSKNKRNIDMLMTALAKDATDPYLYYQLGQSYILGDDYQEACNWFSQGLSFDVNPSLEYVQTMVISYGQTLVRLEQYAQALTFTNIYDSFCDLTDFVYLMGRIYYFNDLPVKALGEFLKAIMMPAGKINGSNTFLSYYMIAVIYDQMNNMEIAVMYYRKCGDYPAARERLAALNLL